MEMKSTKKCECGVWRENVSDQKKKKLWFFKVEDKDKQHNIFVLFIRCSIYSALIKTVLDVHTHFIPEESKTCPQKSLLIHSTILIP